MLTGVTKLLGKIDRPVVDTRVTSVALVTGRNNFVVVVVFVAVVERLSFVKGRVIDTSGTLGVAGWPGTSGMLGTSGDAGIVADLVGDVSVMIVVLDADERISVFVLPVGVGNRSSPGEVTVKPPPVNLVLILNPEIVVMLPSSNVVMVGIPGVVLVSTSSVRVDVMGRVDTVVTSSVGMDVITSSGTVMTTIEISAVIENTVEDAVVLVVTVSLTHSFCAVTWSSINVTAPVNA